MQINSNCPEKDLWIQDVNYENSGYGIAFFSREKQLDSSGNFILEGVPDPFNFEAGMRETYVTAFNEESSFWTQIIAEFFEEMETSFPGEEALIRSSNRDNWSPIINTIGESKNGE